MASKILFIHHSTGANLIRQGHFRKILHELNPTIEFWDHGYNLYSFHVPEFLANATHHSGLSDNKGRGTGKDFNIFLSNNSPKEYAEIFSRDPNDPTLKAILAFDVIAFKNCYPTTKILSDQQLDEYKKYYKLICDSIAKYKDKKFILFTPPPLRKELTTEKNAQRAKELVRWLTNEEFLSGTKNISVFDFFNLLADNEGYLKKEYTRWIYLDSHPNKKANKEIAVILAKYLSDFVN